MKTKGLSINPKTWGTLVSCDQEKGCSWCFQGTEKNGVLCYPEMEHDWLNVLSSHLWFGRRCLEQAYMRVALSPEHLAQVDVDLVARLRSSQNWRSLQFAVVFRWALLPRFDGLPLVPFPKGCLLSRTWYRIGVSGYLPYRSHVTKRHLLLH